MANGNPANADDKPPTKRTQSRKPYIKPAFRFERVFETQALNCGKVHSHLSPCKTNPKTS